MAGKSLGVATPFRWLQQSLALPRRHPRALAGAAAVLVVVALLPTVLQLVLLQVMPGQASGIQALGFVVSLLIYPPAVGGFYRVVHALETGAETAPMAVLELFGDGPAMLRMIIVNLLFVLATVLVVTALAAGLGGEALLEFIRQTSQLKPGATALPPLPAGVLPMLAAMLLFLAALVSAQGFAMAEAALGGRRPLAAVVAAVTAALRNYGALLLFYVVMLAFGFVALMLVTLAGLLLGGVLSLISPALGTVVLMAFGLLLSLAIYALLFTFFYFGWRELFDVPPSAPPPPSPHEFAA